MSVTIYIADDHQIVRKGLRAILEEEQDFRVIGEASDGLQAVQMVESLRPDILVVDIMMPGLTGLEVTRQVHERLRQTHIIVLSMHSNEAYVLEVLKHGASGYVLKDSSTDEIVVAIRHVLQGLRYLSPSISERAIDAYLEKARESAIDPYESLTNREREVLHLAAEGLSNPEIARKLIISPRTVDTHRSNLMRKLGLRSQTDLIRFAMRRGIIE